MLTIKDLTIVHQSGKIIIDHLNLVVKEHDHLAIIGEEGNGKSTLMKVLFNQSLDYVHVEGKIEYINEKIGYLSQVIDPCWKDSLPYEYCLKENVNDEIEPEKYNELQNLKQQCIQLNLPLDFIERDTPIHQLSGGEKVKLQLLKLLHSNATLFLLDEPTNDLDIETLQWLENFIHQSKHILLFISHDETLLEKCATSILLLESVNKKTKVKHTFYNGPYLNFINDREQSILKEEQIANKEKQEYLAKKQRLNQIMNSVHYAQNTITRQDPATGRLLKKKMHALKSMEKRFEQEGYTKLDTLEEAIDVYFEPFNWNPNKIICDFQANQIQVDNRTLIEHVVLFIKGKDKIVITGPNGCGKTTLLHHIYQQLQNRQDLIVGYMPQNYHLFMDIHQTPIEFLSISHTKEEITQIRSLLGRMKFMKDEMIQPISHCSEGQKAKLYLLRFILLKCNILILDEPTRNLSPLSNPVLRKILLDFDGAILSVSHDRKYIEEVCSSVYRIENKKLMKVK